MPKGMGVKMSDCYNAYSMQAQAQQLLQRRQLPSSDAVDAIALMVKATQQQLAASLGIPAAVVNPPPTSAAFTYLPAAVKAAILQNRRSAGEPPELKCETLAGREPYQVTRRIHPVRSGEHHGHSRSIGLGDRQSDRDLL